MQSLHLTSDQSGLARYCVKLKCLNWYFYPQRTFHRLETVCVAFVCRSGGGGVIREIDQNGTLGNTESDPWRDVPIAP